MAAPPRPPGPFHAPGRVAVLARTVQASRARETGLALASTGFPGLQAVRPRLSIRPPSGRDVAVPKKCAMGMNPRYRQWGAAQWKGVAPTVADLSRLGWPCHAQCWTCRTAFKVRLDRIARERGPGFSLWGRSAPCSRLDCNGRVVFVTRPPRADGDVWMILSPPIEKPSVGPPVP